MSLTGMTAARLPSGLPRSPARGVGWNIIGVSPTVGELARYVLALSGARRSTVESAPQDGFAASIAASASANGQASRRHKSNPAARADREALEHMLDERVNDTAADDDDDVDAVGPAREAARERAARAVHTDPTNSDAAVAAAVLGAPADPFSTAQRTLRRANTTPDSAAAAASAVAAGEAEHGKGITGVDPAYIRKLR